MLFLVSNSCFSQKNQDRAQIDLFISQAKIDSARIYVQTRLLEDLNVDHRMVLQYELVKLLFIQSDYKQALKVAFDSIDKIDQEDQKVKFNFMIGCIYSAINDYKQSLKYLDLVALHSKDSTLIVQTQLLLSELHLELRDSIQALNPLTIAHEM